MLTRDSRRSGTAMDAARSRETPDPNPADRARLPLPRRFLRTGARLSRAATIAFAEGPAYHSDGSVYFSDIINNRVMKLAADGQLSVFRADSGRTNGNLFDSRGRLVSCEGCEMGPGGRRRMVRTDLETGRVEVLTERFEGRRYNSPNDLAIDRKGRIYFTDPCYGDRSTMEMDVEAVYRLDCDCRVSRILEQPAIQQPNGIAVSPDDRFLYVADYNISPGGARKIWRFELDPGGVPSGQTLVYDFGVGRPGDGLRVDMQGNLWTAAGITLPKREGESNANPAGIYVISPQGRLLDRIPIPEDVVTNMTFGGGDKKTLYVTAGKSLFKIGINVPGYSPFPQVNTRALPRSQP
ncbi:MAG: SMP-30/gluconolactonase/LRE family protein [Acidobacteriota bacterium]|nr:SMP-30/gluconolactonase/LRE family protein [Acidobacteriota bacterium]